MAGAIMGLVIAVGGFYVLCFAIAVVHLAWRDWRRKRRIAKRQAQFAAKVR
jgi:hypothetical protein